MKGSDLRVLFEDNHLLIVVKPPGIPTQGDSSGDPSMLDIAKAYIKERYNKPGEVYIGMVHRLDRPTGGVLALAKTSKAASRLSDQFRQRRVKKTYIAACQGVPNPSSGKLVHFLKKLPGVNRMVAMEREKNGSARAELSFRTLGVAKDGRSALLEVDPLTGRQHQIRAQLARIDHPLLFDVKYSNVRSGTAIVPAIGLWAQRLRIEHPTSGKLLDFSAWPEARPGTAWADFADLLRAGSAPSGENPPASSAADAGPPKGDRKSEAGRRPAKPRDVGRVAKKSFGRSRRDRKFSQLDF